MTRTLIVVASLLTASAALAQQPQQPQQVCKPHTTQAACEAVAWCHWVRRQAIVVDGKQIELSSCGFKSGAKQAWEGMQQAKR